MNENESQGNTSGRDDATMQRLLHLAGPRSPVPEDIEARVYERVLREWQASSQKPDDARVYKTVRREWARGAARQRLRRWAFPAALAATALLAVAVVLQPAPPVTADLPIGTVVRAVGGIDPGSLPAAGEHVYAGQKLVTGAGQKLSMLLNTSQSLRIDENTALIASTRNDFKLLRGRVYADTGDFMYRDKGLVIETAMGSVTDVGTQFAVAVGDDRLDVAVREGRVDVDAESGDLVAVAGERLRLQRGADATIDSLPPNDPYWDWAASLAPVFDIENQSLLEFLRWAARETGRELVFANNELRMAAMRTDLHGSVSNFEPLEAIDAVLATTRFSYRVEPGRIVIER